MKRFPSYPVVMNASVAPRRMPRRRRWPCDERCTSRRRGALAKRSLTALGICFSALSANFTICFSVSSCDKP
eukprot:Skav225067  [mRNA]  locus=scaffold2293:111814:113601:+ [translate_table: standard]